MGTSLVTLLARSGPWRGNRSRSVRCRASSRVTLASLICPTCSSTSADSCSSPNPARCRAVSTRLGVSRSAQHKVQALPHPDHHPLHLLPIGRAALPLPRLAVQSGWTQQPQETLAVHARHLLHLIQQRSSALPIRMLVPRAYPLEVLPPLVDRHLFLVDHACFPPVTFSFEGTIPASVTF